MTTVAFSPCAFVEHAPASNEKLIDHSDMYALDFLPSLKTMSIIAVKKYKLDFSELPSKLK